MFLIELVKKSFFLQSLAGWVCRILPPFVEHNLGKYYILKKAMYVTAIEELEGDYFEFGVFTGSSFVFAAKMYLKLKSIGKHSCKFFGFDSFEGFGDVRPEDKHPFYVDHIFKVNAEQIISNIKKHTYRVESQIVKGYFDDTLTGKTAKDFGSKKARIVFIDCDLKIPSKLAFSFVKPVLQKGTVLILDDYFSYRGDINLGVQGAFEEFKKEHPEFEWRMFSFYGYGGMSFICSKAPGA